MSELGFEARLAQPFESALERVVAALQAEGFGVLTRIDVDEAFREKLGVDFRRYVILGACNPPLAHQALNARPDAGLMLPCNVTVEAAEGGATLVRIVDPRAMLQAGGLQDDPALRAVADEAELRLARVADALRA